MTGCEKPIAAEMVVTAALPPDYEEQQVRVRLCKVHRRELFDHQLDQISVGMPWPPR